MTRRILSLWLPSLASERWAIARQAERRRKREREAGGAAEDAPFALIEEVNGRPCLTALSRTAAAAGLCPGQPLAAARAQLPALQVAARAPAREAARLEQLQRWSLRYTPWSATDPLGEGAADQPRDPGSRALASLGYGGGAGLFLDVSGCAHLFGGEAALMEDLRNRLAKAGHSARLGLAGTPGAAWALARFATTEGRAACRIDPGAEAKALQNLPAAALRLPPAQVGLLKRLGLGRIGDLRGIAPASLTARLGPLPGRRLDQALGRLEEAISPETPKEIPWAAERFLEPLGTPEAVAHALSRLIKALCAQLERRGLGARQVAAYGQRVDGSPVWLAIGTSRPSRQAAHLERLFAPERERLDPGFGLELLRLTVPHAEPLDALQEALPRTQLLPDNNGSAGFAALIDRLQARLGPGAVRQPRLAAHRLPEAAEAFAAPFAPAPNESPGGSPPAAPRPQLLFPRPQGVDALALLPEAPPQRMIWQGQAHRLRRAEGPERIEPAWWRPAEASAPRRDYYRVEDEAGRRFWLYRADRQWFLHGLFA